MMRDHQEAFDELETEYSDVRDLGDQLVAIAVTRALGRESGVEIKSPLKPLSISGMERRFGSAPSSTR